MKRWPLAFGGISALAALFFFVINRLGGDRWAQGMVALAYVLGVVLLTRWGNRRLMCSR